MIIKFDLFYSIFVIKIIIYSVKRRTSVELVRSVMGSKLEGSIDPGHVLADQEGSMATRHLLVVDDGLAAAADGVSGPPGVRYVAEIVTGADKHCHWELCDLVQKDYWWCVLAILLLIQGL